MVNAETVDEAYHIGLIHGWQLALIEYVGESQEYATGVESQELLIEAAESFND